MGVKLTFIAAILLAAFSNSFGSSLDATGLQISVAGDLVAEQGLSSDSDALERLSPRSFEIVFYAPLDHRFDAVASATAHDERGELFFETHEL